MMVEVKVSYCKVERREVIASLVPARLISELPASLISGPSLAQLPCTEPKRRRSRIVLSLLITLRRGHHDQCGFWVDKKLT